VLAATNDIFRQYGKPAWSAEEFRDKFFLPFPEFYKIHLPEATLVEIDHYYHTSFKLLQDDIPLLPGALKLLDYCEKEGLQLFLLSTIHREHWEVQGERLGVKKYFKQAYVQAIDKRKTILHLLAEHDLDPNETMFLGDMVHDLETAHHGGVIAAGVLGGYTGWRQLQSAKPDLIFKNLDHVLGHLQRHRSSPAYHPVATVGALIFNAKNEVLMIHTHKWSNKWGIPGGKIQTNEKAIDALHREVIEETGLTLHDVKFEMVHDCIGSTEFYKPAHFLLLNYTAHTTQNDVTLNEEAEEYLWLPMEKALELDLNQPTIALIEHALANKTKS
jgi:phosphoglycolate phosphatase-like HAD superfamily hydrolase/8-oxo-dGTP pyrophosphatase MutT (NUDIX family)